MKYSFPKLLITVVFLFAQVQASAQFQYISPVSGSKYHNPTTSILLKNGSRIEETSLRTKDLFHVEGSVSGKHEVEIKLLENGMTIMLKPVKPFASGETVTVDIADGIITEDGIKLRSASFSFEIRRAWTEEEKQRISEQMKQLHDEEFGTNNNNADLRDGTGGLPGFEILTNTAPAPGEIFFSHFNYYNGNERHYCIIENDGDSVYGKFDTVSYNNFDLNLNGYLTLYNEGDSSFSMLDSNYRKIAQYQMDGYVADVHEFVIYPNGNHYMLAYDPQIVDMTVYDESYQPNATVIGCIIQELDAANNLLFEWRSWDHYSILDGDHVSFGNMLIDYCHANTIFKDNDGNLLFCCRNMSEVTKINRGTGDIMWRWGGKNNEFTFIGDEEEFSYQHDARRIANGNITMFDNGNYNATNRSYAGEYLLDEVNKTATLVWRFHRTAPEGDVNAIAMGNMQRLPNGNTFINWGLFNGQPLAPSLTEVNNSGTVVWEMGLDDPDAIYRAHRYVWEPCARPSAAGVFANKITSTTTKINWKAATNASSYDVVYKRQGNFPTKVKSTVNLSKKLMNLKPNTTYLYQVKSHCDSVPTATSGLTAVKTFTTLPLREELMVAEIIFMELYPNPAGNIIFMNVDLDEDQDITISFYDITGKEVYKHTHLCAAGVQVLQFDVSDLTEGVYMARLKTVTGNTTQKFVKQ